MSPFASSGTLLVAGILAFSFTGCSQASFSNGGGADDGGGGDGAKGSHDASRPGNDATHADASHPRNDAGDSSTPDSEPFDVVPHIDAAKDAGTDAATPDETACAMLAEAECTLRSTCTNGFNVSVDFGTLPQCEIRSAAQCVASLTANGSGQTRMGVDNCASGFPTESCTSYFDGNPIAACVPTGGSITTGGACAFNSQCATTFCAAGPKRVCGTCAPGPSVGSPCQIQADCGRDLGCATPAGAASGTCAAFALPGASCLTGVNPCQEGYSCVGDSVATTTSGICTLSGATTGATCDGAHKVAPICNTTDGFICIPAAAGSTVGTCKPITLATAGEPCGNVGVAPITGSADCVAGGLCVTTSTGARMCVAAVADGMACDSTLGPPCQEPSKCVPTADGGTAGTCVPLSAATCM